MFSSSFAKNLLCTVAAISMLSSCGLIEKKTDTEPSHSWKADKNYNHKGEKEANLATVAFSQGDFKAAEEHIINALANNPRQPQALLVGALLYEQLGRTNRSRQYYEDLILINGDETTILGTNNMKPEKISEIAKKRLRLINVKQSELIIEDKDGAKVFNISEEASQKQGKSAMEEALFLREKKNINNTQAMTEANIKAVEILFTEEEKNVISRFLILKELAENDLITKEEFLKGRMSNVGGILPLSNTPPAYGIDNPVPSPDLIIERINVLKEAVESRAITPREFSAERNLIIEAILPPQPRQRMKPKAPAKDILTAAKDIRKLEVLSDLNLITSKEKAKEQSAIEKRLGISNSAPKVANVAQSVKVQATPETKEVVDTKIEIEESIQDIENIQPLVPDVSSPF